MVLGGQSREVIMLTDDNDHLPQPAASGQELAFALDRPVRRSAKVAANNLADRVHWLREDPALLSGVRVVVYEVTARALSSADWSGARIEPTHHKRRKP